MLNYWFTVYLRSPEGVYIQGSGFVADDESGIQLSQDTENPIVVGATTGHNECAQQMARDSLAGRSVFIPAGNIAMYIWHGQGGRQ